jgi:hypothetical protein
MPTHAHAIRWHRAAEGPVLARTFLPSSKCLLSSTHPGNSVLRLIWGSKTLERSEKREESGKEDREGVGQRREGIGEEDREGEGQRRAGADCRKVGRGSPQQP